MMKAIGYGDGFDFSAERKRGRVHDTSDPEVTGFPLDDLDAGTCRWPGAEWEGEHLFCGARALPGGSYCARHRARPYRKSDGDEE